LQAAPWKDSNWVVVHLDNLKGQTQRKFLASPMVVDAVARKYKAEGARADMKLEIFRHAGSHLSAVDPAGRLQFEGTIQRRVSRYMERKGLGTRTHDLRVTRATELYRGVLNKDINALKEILGHVDVKTTLRYVKTRADEAFDRLVAAEGCGDLRG
jgi:integrase